MQRNYDRSWFNFIELDKILLVPCVFSLILNHPFASRMPPLRGNKQISQSFNKLLVGIYFTVFWIHILMMFVIILEFTGCWTKSSVAVWTLTRKSMGNKQDDGGKMSPVAFGPPA